MKNVLVPILTFLCVSAFGQNLTLERLNASKIDNSILFRLENVNGFKLLTYEIDTRDHALGEKNTSRSHQVEGNKLTLASTGTSFNILFDFFNPLRYSYKINHQENADPSTIAYESFYNYVLGTAQKINSNADLNNLKSIEVSQVIQNSFEAYLDFTNKITDISSGGQLGTKSEKVNDVLKTLTVIKSPELLDWILWYYKGNFTGPTKTSVDSLVKKIKTIEKTIYSPIANDYLIDAKKDQKIFYESYIIQLFEDLRKADSFDEFSKSLNLIRSATAKLKAGNQKLRSDHESMKKVVLVDSKVEADSYFVAYTQQKVNTYSERITGIVKTREDLLDKFEKLLDEIDSKYIVTRSSPITTKPYIVKTKIGSIEKVDIIITETKYAIENNVIKKSETKLYNFMLDIYEHTSIVAEFGLGSLFFTPVENYSYSIVSGSVLRSETNKIVYTPAASLNLVPNIGKGQAFWMLQLAVGSSINTPSVALGTGLRIYSVRSSAFRNFSITTGIVSVFTRQLNKLAEGSPATQAALVGDLQYAPVFRPYIGIQINF
jgi:hypothetical protein